MAYYAALVSLRQTINHHLNSSQLSFLPTCKQTMELASEVIASLVQVLDESEKEDWRFLKYTTNDDVVALMGQIRDSAYKLEDSLESQVSYMFSSSESHSLPVNLSPDLGEIKQGIDYLEETVEKLVMMMEELITNPLPVEENDYVSPRVHFEGHRSKMVGFSDTVKEIKGMLTSAFSEPISLSGMAGIGKSRIAKEIYEDQLDFHYFDCCAWMKIGPESEFKKVLLHDKLHEEGVEILFEDLYSALKDKIFLLVVDDVWRESDWLKVKELLPHEDDPRSRVLLTGRMEKVGGVTWTMEFLDEEESWDLLRQKVFGEECLCPFQLQKLGKKIAKKCEGLPLTIVTVANILSKSEKTVEYWNKVAMEQYSSVFMEAYEQMSKVLFPSYKYLPQHVKAAFLYLGGLFPPSSKIHPSKIMELWAAEGFLPQKKCKLQNHYFDILVLSSVLNEYNYNFGLSYSLNSAFWYLCTREARKDRFFHILRTYPNSFAECVESRRFAVYNNVLFGMKNVQELMESVPSIRSLLCTGTKHQYPVPLFTSLRLLRVLDALTMCYYNFPAEVLKFIHLRYLTLTCSRNIPTSISNLWNLEVFIVHRLLSINKPFGDQPYLPIEIWDLQHLKHLQVMGSNLPIPCDGAPLRDLLKLSDISVHSCTKEILGKVPNLKKLGVRIELEPYAIEPKRCFDHLYVLGKLESLKCVVVNPYFAYFNKHPIVVPPAFVTSFPSTLTKLTLSGLGYPWECMRVIAQLTNLRTLQLLRYAFRGPEWVVHEGDFQSLDYLLLDELDLVRWKSDGEGDYFRDTAHLIIRHCYKLKEVPSSLEDNIYKWDIVDCPSIEDYAKSLGETCDIEVTVKSSWNDEEMNS